MAIIKNGNFSVVAGTVAQNLNLGFIPTRFTMWNQTLLTATPSAGIVQAMWVPQLAALSPPAATSAAWIDTSTITTGAIARSLLVENAISTFQSSDSQLYPSTNLTITGISKAANASITATHAFTSADIGITTVTFHGVVGMNQINTLSGVIQTVTSTTSFTVNINSTGFSTYTSGGIANIITGSPAYIQFPNIAPANIGNPNASFQVQNTPLYNQGYIGLTLGTSLMVNTGDIWVYEAVLDADFTSA